MEEEQSGGATAREALAGARARLDAAGVASPGLDAELLLAHILRVDRTRFLARGDEPLTGAQAAAFRGLVERRAAGECAAYLTGRREFWGLEFAVTPDVLVPQPDTETLVEAALDWLRGPGAAARALGTLRALDLCTGSGAVAVALKHEMPELEVWASDISAAALAVASGNAARLLGNRDAVRFVRAGIFRSPFPAPPFRRLFPRAFSLIVSNPPYIPTNAISALPAEVRFQPALALDGGADGLRLIRRVIARAGKRLVPGGGLFLETDPHQAETVRTLLERRGFTDIRTRRDLAGAERVTGGARGAGFCP
ncbi:MAG: peptide chain release factor N(5)-glutamine methyltransferase [Treponematales bacterium]